MIALYGHPFAMFAWKALIALYEREVPFEFRVLGADHPDHVAFCAEHQPGGQMPVLVDGARVVIESNAVVEYIDRIAPGGSRLLPDDPFAAIEARQLADVFDDYVAMPMQRVVSNAIRPADARDPYGVTAAKAELDRSYAWLERWMAGREWAACGAFTLADIAAAPSLFYADWVQPIGGRYPKLAAYRARLLARGSVARVVDEARPYRHFFPLGAPDRD